MWGRGAGAAAACRKAIKGVVVELVGWLGEGEAQGGTAVEGAAQGYGYG